MVIIKNKQDCCGCSSCVHVCPKQCISMEEDHEGFLYPKVDEYRCIDCHLCEMKCPIINPKRLNSIYVPQVYAAISKNTEVRIQSSSGGVFSLFAEQILLEGGLVYGASFDKKFFVRHTRIDSLENLFELRGSKYVQSCMGDIFSLVKKDLKNGRKVLFSGTPCQVEGLLSSLGKDAYNENLITIDFICHGVPSPKVWKKYVQEKRKILGEDINIISFREKKWGWRSFCLYIETVTGKSYRKILTFDKYMQAFLRNISLRPSCYNCQFKKEYRHSDVTLADYWGIQNIDRSMFDGKGTSMVLINSDKGNKMFTYVADMMNYKKESYTLMKASNAYMEYSANEPLSRKDFFANIDYLSFDALYDKTVKLGLVYEAKNRVKGVVKILMGILER